MRGSFRMREKEQSLADFPENRRRSGRCALFEMPVSGRGRPSEKKFVARQFDESAFAYKMKDCLSYFASARYPIVRKMNDFVKDVSIGKGLYLSGDPKTGKSFLLSVFAVRLSKEPTTKSIAFIDCPNEFASMQACFRDNLTMFRFYLEEMQEAQYLFLDDLGKEFKTNSF